MTSKRLFSPIKIGGLELQNRVVMAPMTRARSIQPGDIPQGINATYYAQRAGAGLIISEATQISPQGKGYAFTPGIHSSEQIAGWKAITDAVHDKDSRMFLQLWHVGRISHTSLQPNGAQPVAPSAIAAQGDAFTEEGPKPFEVPRVLQLDELPGIVDQFVQAAINADKAGFDGVEIHGANGYLLDQFLRDATNDRDDKYGGSYANRVRLTLDVVSSVTNVLGSNRVGLRISPTSSFNSMHDSDPQPLFEHLARELSNFDLAYLHVLERMGDDVDDKFDFRSLRDQFDGPYMANGGYTADSAEKSLARGDSDLVSFGVPFIANPDLPERMKSGIALSEPDSDTFYGGTEKGYIDYPTHS